MTAETRSGSSSVFTDARSDDNETSSVTSLPVQSADAESQPKQQSKSADSTPMGRFLYLTLFSQHLEHFPAQMLET